MLAAIESEKLILSTTSNNYGQHGLLTNGLEKKNKKWKEMKQRELGKTDES